MKIYSHLNSNNNYLSVHIFAYHFINEKQIWHCLLILINLVEKLKGITEFYVYEAVGASICLEVKWGCLKKNNKKLQNLITNKLWDILKRNLVLSLAVTFEKIDTNQSRHLYDALLYKSLVPSVANACNIQKTETCHKKFFLHTM